MPDATFAFIRPAKERVAMFSFFRRTPPPPDLRTVFLSDLAMGQPEPLADYKRMMADPRAAREDIQWICDTVPDQDLPDLLLLEVLDRYQLVGGQDWAAAPEEIMVDFFTQFDRHDVVLPEEVEDRILDYAYDQPEGPGTFVGWVFGPLAEFAADNGLRILHVNSGSDAYQFFAARQGLYDKWVDTRLSDHLSIEDPSWQFKKQLLGSPYERFYRPLGGQS